MGKPIEPHYRYYPVSWVARELGVDRVSLLRKLEADGVDTSDGVTLKVAFEAEVEKSKQAADRARKTKNEADLTEIAIAEKRKQLIPADDAGRLLSELSIRTLQTIKEAAYIPESHRKRLVREIQEMAKEVK